MRGLVLLVIGALLVAAGLWVAGVMTVLLGQVCLLVREVRQFRSQDPHRRRQTGLR